MDFSNMVLSIVERIPRGRVTTYKEIAIALGNKNLARVVGLALRRNPRLIEVPCHRVVYSDGRVGGYVLGVDRKKELLMSEGIGIENDRIVDFDRILVRADFLRD
ncbi:MAG: cysteine methyltransferase [Candidatus Altiarchaeales archaeon]|nr:MAG: cysteine methyltransferase [Candidatus Altiarchaeales archaeon]RLI93694.1 MAG: cysteine methyltransferase [Candidatus Altiarchaeales archaeon]RLI94695.1 MAG: cysteine methyltransferase [Candidatus Altiarchaeales archaeon]HDO82678.1 MGMT family protein [Candidatus Altiarchaeales archaeon]HEX55327.1 MGMT family protein [Candidatus Altiarchaeales archaeon]